MTEPRPADNDPRTPTGQPAAPSQPRGLPANTGIELKQPEQADHAGHGATSPTVLPGQVGRGA
jgi:hypothetical protein